MKNRIFGWLIVFFFLVFFGLPVAEAAVSANNTPRATEELLVCIRDFLANPNADGIAFVERVTGVDKADWGPVHIRHGFDPDTYANWAEYLVSDFKQPLKIPYIIPPRIGFDEQVQRLLYLEFVFLRYVKTTNSGNEYDYLLELTPALAQKFLGPPDKISVNATPWNAARGGSFADRYYVSYRYRRRRYELRIPFSRDWRVRRKHVQLTKEQMWAEKRRRKLFKNHKDFLAINMELTREK